MLWSSKHLYKTSYNNLRLSILTLQIDCICTFIGYADAIPHVICLAVLTVTWLQTMLNRELVIYIRHNSEHMHVFPFHLVVGFILDVATLHLAKHSDQAWDKGLNDGCLSLVQEWLQSFVDDITIPIPAQLCTCLW